MFLQNGYTQEINVAIAHSPPWIILEENQEPKGFSIDLWQWMAEDIGLNTQWIYQNGLSETLVSVKQQHADIGLVNYPTTNISLGLQVATLSKPNLMITAKRIYNALKENIKPQMILYPLLVFLAMSIFRWLVDRFSKEPSFSKNFFIGIYEAFWWTGSLLIQWDGPSANKGFARLFDFSWHMIGLLLISGFVGVLTSALAFESLGKNINSQEDLIGKQIAVLADKQAIVQELQANATIVNSLEEAKTLLLNGKVDVIIDSSKKIQYFTEIHNQKPKAIALSVAPFTIKQPKFGFILPSNSPYQAKIQQAFTHAQQVKGLDPSPYQQFIKKWKIDDE